MISKYENDDIKHVQFERYFVALIALTSALNLAFISLGGPLALNIIKYRFSEATEWQVMGQDLANLLILAPICLIGGILLLRDNKGAYTWLALPGLYMMYTGMSYAIGNEWSHPAYQNIGANVESYSFFLIWMSVSGLILLVYSIPHIDTQDAPDLNPNVRKVIVGLMTVLLTLFTFMWLGEMFEVANTGTLAGSTAYEDGPTLFWVIRTFDLSLSFPLGFISIYLLATRPKKAYPLLLAFFGFFVTMGTAVVLMAVVMVLNNDPSVQVPLLVILPTLMILSYSCFFLLVREKIQNSISRLRN